MNCLICRETYAEINKICICRESFLCNSCLKLSNENKIKRCPICRKDLKIKKSKNYLKYSFLLISEILIQLFIYLVPLVILIYMYTEHDNNINTLNENYYFVIFNVIFLIVFLEPINIHFFKKFFDVEYQVYQIIKCGASLVISAILSIALVSEIKFKYYFVLILVPFYYFPSILGSCILLNNFIKKIMSFNDSKTIVKYIKFEKIIADSFDSITQV